MMKNHLTKCSLAAFLAVTGFSSVAQAAVENITVQLNLNTDQTQLEVTTVGRCSNKNHNGCITVAKSKQARINFSFVENRKCNKPGGVSWKIGDVYLGGKNSSDKPSSWGNLDSDVKADFDVADSASGRLNKGSGSNDQSIIISDQNKTKYNIWYKVTANCVDANGATVGTLVTDPRIENGGN